MNKLQYFFIATITFSLIFSCHRISKNNQSSHSEKDTTPITLDYRSISFHYSYPDMDLIQQAKEIGYNDVTLQTELWQSLVFLGLWPQYKKPEEVPHDIHLQHECFKFIKDLNDTTGWLDEIKDMGMTISLWTREIEDYQPEWGPVEVGNERLWNEIYNRYVYLCDTMLPQVDYIILTLAESRSWTSSYDLVLKTCQTVHEACKASGVELIVRTFFYRDKQGVEAFEAVRELPDDVIIMSKFSQNDWHIYRILHPYLGTYAPKREILEEDVAGEYYKKNRIANSMAALHKKNFDKVKAKFLDYPENLWGINIRVNRGFDPENYRGSVFNEVQEADMWAYAYWAAGKSEGYEQPVKDWAAHKFGDSLADVTAEIFLSTGEVVANSLFVSGEPFGDTRRDVPGILSTGGKDEKGRETPLKQAQRLETFEPIIESNPFIQRRSNSVNDSAWIPNMIRLVKGDKEIIAEKEKIYKATVELAENSLACFRALEDEIDKELFEYYEFKLMENTYLARFYGQAALAWLKASRWLYTDDPEKKKQLRNEVSQHLAYIEKMEEETAGFSEQELKVGDREYNFRLGDYGYKEFVHNLKGYFFGNK